MSKKFKSRARWCSEKLTCGGYRLTLTRESIIIVLNKTKEHLSVDEIYLEVKKIHSSAGLASVYRTLDVLTELGLVHKLEFGEGKARYELVSEKENHDNHHHLICTTCSKIIHYDELLDEERAMSKETAKKLTEKYKFQIDRHNVQYFGICEKCSIS